MAADDLPIQGTKVSEAVVLHKLTQNHDDVIKWKHFPRYWPFVRGIHRSPVNSPHKDKWHRALMFSLLCARINGWANNGDTGDLRRHLAHYDVIVMYFDRSTRRLLPFVYLWTSLPFYICSCMPTTTSVHKSDIDLDQHRFSHYLNQCCLIIRCVLSHSPESKFISAHELYP